MSTILPTVEATLRLSVRTLSWLAQRPHARLVVDSVWNTLVELERADHHPRLLAAVRFVLSQAIFIYYVMTCVDVLQVTVRRDLRVDPIGGQAVRHQPWARAHASSHARSLPYP
ncbi:MAG: hypothetical protein ACRDTA_08225 [Pseudonocardiaceae bacterium]